MLRFLFSVRSVLHLSAIAGALLSVACDTGSEGGPLADESTDDGMMITGSGSSPGTPSTGGTSSGGGGGGLGAGPGAGGTFAAGGTGAGVSGDGGTGATDGPLDPVACAHATGTSYHVAAEGDDATGDGSETAPWRTITHALGQVPADQGHAILLSAGTFEEEGILNIPSGVSLLGAGSGATTVRVNHRFDFLQHGTTCDGAPDASYDNYDEHFVIQMDGSNQCVSGFFLQGIVEGSSRKNHGGIFADSAKNVIFSELRIEDFVFAGLWVHTSEDTEVHHCTLRNNAWYNNATDTGNLLFYANTGLRIHHNLIEVTDPVRGPYGIKAYSTRWSNFCWWQWWDQNWATFADGMEITDNTVLVPEMAGWTIGGNNIPGIAIEFNGISMKNVLIARNHLNNVVSLVGSYNNDGYSFWSARLINNWFDLGPQYRYAVEANIPGLEFAYNFVDGGLYPLAQWDGGRGALPRQSIHHNVFNAQQDGQPLFQYGSSVTDLSFEYNTVVDTRGISAVFAGASQPGIVRGNVFSATSPRGEILGAFHGTVERNLFFNIPASGGSPVTGDPQLNASGDMPHPWFALSDTSPAINAGVSVPGLTDGAVGAPDLGAFESGATPWTVGPMR